MRVSIEIVRTEIRKFLAGTEPEVISITGHWGVGKTYAWRRYLVEARDEKKIGLSTTLMCPFSASIHWKN